MAKNVYIGHIQNDIYDVKTLVIAESVTEAREKVLEKFSKSISTTFKFRNLMISELFSFPIVIFSIYYLEIKDLLKI